MGKHGNDKARFETFVSKTDDCWLFIGTRRRNGYGQFHMGGRCLKAHRASWELYIGAIPDGLHVLHDCPNGDRRDCVNPDHLWLGTNDDNIRDKLDKGRHAGQRRMTPEQVEAIRSCDGKACTMIALARSFGVSPASVDRVFRRETWADTE